MPDTAAIPKPRLVNFTCSKCGSDEVVSDAWAEWSVEDQEWQLGQVFDQTFCLACESDCSLVTEDDVTAAAET